MTELKLTEEYSPNGDTEAELRRALVLWLEAAWES